MSEDKGKLGLWMLILIGIGSMIGGGIFNSPTDMIQVANPQAAIIAWIIGGVGIIGLALVFSMLANKKPELTGGIYTYAREGFGEFAGFNSAWGYWISAWLGNVAFIVLLFKTLGDLVGGLNPLISFILGSLFLWAVYFMQMRGTKNTGAINSIVTVAKLIPIFLAIVLGILVFKGGIFFVPNWKNVLASTGRKTNVLTQISRSMGTILWSFVGVEAAAVLSERAKSQKVVSKAIITSLLVTLAIYMLVSLITMGVVEPKALGKSVTPFADLLGNTIIGKSGALIAKLGLIISLVGAFISWVMLAAEIPYLVAKDGSMPKWFSELNENGTPRNSLLVTTICTQIFIFALLSNSFQKAYFIIYSIATTSIVIPYLFSALYGLKISFTDGFTTRDKVISIIASVYTIYVVYAIGITYLGLTIILYALGIYIYIRSSKENGKEISKNDKLAMIIITLIAIFMLVMLLTGRIKI
ncbi:basic amino acid/polyamine antiporter [Hathewaya histolytica]|uniref:basic amino acid/polyamine antiporter n=1 Tax=Hathewaya histolytica TaxID=1498 RepID=UPI003B670201